MHIRFHYTYSHSICSLPYVSTQSDDRELIFTSSLQNSVLTHKAQEQTWKVPLGRKIFWYIKISRHSSRMTFLLSLWILQRWRNSCFIDLRAGGWRFSVELTLSPLWTDLVREKFGVTFIGPNHSAAGLQSDYVLRVQRALSSVMMFQNILEATLELNGSSIRP